MTLRNKKVRKNLGFYVNNYKFHQPFQILIDGTFAFAALQNKFNIQEQLKKYFQSELKLLTTPCIISETEKLSINGATQIVKQYAVHKCGHEKKSISGSKCLLSMIGKNNSSRYIIATQDRELQDKLRLISGVPLIYLHGKTPTLESPSEASRKCAEVIQKDLGMTTWQKENIKVLQEQAGIIQQKDDKLKKRRKMGGPNPLSCLKKKKKPEIIISSKNGTKSGKIRKRKIKIASHIKEALITELKNKRGA
ncbi:rRNA-processing protein UTP23 homolog [Polyergus mexicanus]|uniref:rRNA-processing protein UTP23 homolog n=1 Tax=Polyergus mexicanus TaxID=615972 RepID=UPI0038B4E2DB